jgi:hypothetical protein
MADEDIKRDEPTGMSDDTDITRDMEDKDREDLQKDFSESE